MNETSSIGQFVSGGRKPIMAMLEVTERCNLSCPVCFTRSTARGQDVSVDQARTYLKQLLEITKTPIPIQLSGGEPTLHADLAAIIASARQLGYRHIELVTNGIHISQDAGLLPALKKAGLKAVYLQFDGLQKDALLRIRGADLTGIRHQAVSAIRAAGLCCTLAVAVVRGINDQEIGDIVRFAINHLDVVRAINFQSATAFDGRFEITESRNGLDTHEILQLIEAQCGVSADSFVSEAIGHPLCNALSLVFVVNGNLLPLFNYIDADDLRSFLGSRPRRKLLDAFEGKKAFFFRHLADPHSWPLLAKAAPIFGHNPYSVLASQHLLLFVKGFMEKEQMDSARIDDCCYAVTGKDGVFSFCAYNNIYRFAGSGRPLSTGIG